MGITGRAANGTPSHEDITDSKEALGQSKGDHETSSNDTCAYAAKFFEQNQRPPRVAFDTPTILFKHIGTAEKSEKYGGMNHAARNFCFNVFDTLVAGVEPVYVYDGPNKPPKLRRAEGSGHVRAHQPKEASSLRSPADVEAEREFGHVVSLSRDILNHLGVPYHVAPAEGEAECVELERQGIVDAVFTTDSDVFVFGVNNLLCWDSGGTKEKSQIPIVHVQARELERAGYSRATWMMTALLFGGDYAGGLPGIDLETAIEAATYNDGRRAIKLLEIAEMRNEDRTGFKGWCGGVKFDLGKILEPDKAKKLRFDSLKIETLELYARPAVAKTQDLDSVLARLLEHRTMNVAEFRSWTERWFDWKGICKARKFLLKLIPALLARELVFSGQSGADMNDLWTRIKIEQVKLSQRPGDVRMIKVRFDHLKLVRIEFEWDREVEIPGYWSKDHEKYDPKNAEPIEIPERLVKYGAPAIITAPSATVSNKKASKRKASAPPSTAKLEAPTDKKVRPCGRGMGTKNSTGCSGTSAQSRPNSRNATKIPAAQPRTDSVFRSPPTIAAMGIWRANAIKSPTEGSRSDNNSGLTPRSTMATEIIDLT